MFNNFYIIHINALSLVNSLDLIFYTIFNTNSFANITRLGVDKVKPKGWFKYF